MRPRRSQGLVARDDKTRNHDMSYRCAGRRNLLRIAASGVLAPLVGPAFSEPGFPAKPLRLVVPFPAGGTTDTLARLLAPRLSARLGQNVIVENRAGASTQIGTMDVVRSPADGYSLLLTGPSTFTASPAVNVRLPYDPIKSFDYISLVGSMPMVMLANLAAPYRNIKDLVATARQEPDKHFYGCFGSGSIAHFAGETFGSLAGVKLSAVPYKGSAPAMTDLVGGQLSLSVDTVVAAAPFVSAGKVRALAVTSARRSLLLPEVPTMNESGYAMDISSWLGIAAPKGLPADVRDRLAKAVAEAVEEPATRDAMLKLGIEAAAPGAKAFEQKVREELALFRRLAVQNDIKPE
jgi:tripartite-type tricarboxylate transporter receptor subunit TctC